MTNTTDEKTSLNLMSVFLPILLEYPVIEFKINHQPRHFKLNPKFSNKETLRPVVAHRPIQSVRVDLVDFTPFHQSLIRNFTHYVLAVLDVFSRYLMF